MFCAIYGFPSAERNLGHYRVFEWHRGTSVPKSGQSVPNGACRSGFSATPILNVCPLTDYVTLKGSSPRSTGWGALPLNLPLGENALLLRVKYQRVKEVKAVNESKTLSLFTNLSKTPPKMAQNSVWPPLEVMWSPLQPFLVRYVFCHFFYFLFTKEVHFCSEKLIKKKTPRGGV